MQLINSNILKSFWTVVLPKIRILRTHKQIVQHLIVCHEYIWRCSQQSIMISNNLIRHHNLGTILFLATNIHAYTNLCGLKLRTSIYQLSHSFGLISSKSIHRINYQCFNSILTTMSIAVLENRIQKTLSFTGTSPCSNQSRTSVFSSQSVECFLLVNIWCMCWMNSLKNVFFILGDTKR